MTSGVSDPVRDSAGPNHVAAGGVRRPVRRGPVNVVVVQDLAPHAPAAAAGMVLSVAMAVAGALYIALGWLQQAVGLTTGMTVGFALVVPAAAIALTVLARHPDASGSP
jgi:BarA-like signal transduction histidine kinase